MKKYFKKIIWEVFVIIITLILIELTNNLSKMNAFAMLWKLIAHNISFIILVGGILVCISMPLYWIVEHLLHKSIENKFNSLINDVSNKIDENKEKLNNLLHTNQTVHFPISTTYLMLIREIIIPKLFTRDELKDAIRQYPYFYLDGLKMCGFDEELQQIAKISKMELDNKNTSENNRLHIEIETERLKKFEEIYSNKKAE